jgi:hypothetical protein
VTDVCFILMSVTGVSAPSAQPSCYRKGNNNVLIDDTLSGAELQFLGNAKVEACRINCFLGRNIGVVDLQYELGAVLNNVVVQNLSGRVRSASTNQKMVYSFPILRPVTVYTKPRHCALS